MVAEMLMNIGTLLLMFAAMPQLASVWKNRYNLKGYSLLGSFVIFVALLFIISSFTIMGMWVSVGAQIPPLILWTSATYFSYKSRKPRKLYSAVEINLLQILEEPTE